MTRSTGQLVRLGSGERAFHAFVPSPLPPHPPINLTAADDVLLGRANRALEKLDAMTWLLPDTSLFIYAYVRKEALVSSQIEGTQSSFADLLLYESDQAPGVPIEDVRQVSDYVAAVGAARHQASSAAARFGSVVLARRLLALFRRRPTASSSVWVPSRNSFTAIR